MVTCRTYTIEKAPTPGFTLTADQYEGIGSFNTILYISYPVGAGQIVRIVNSDSISGDSCLTTDIPLDGSGNATVPYSVTGTHTIYVIKIIGTGGENCCVSFSQTLCQYSNYITFTVTPPSGTGNIQFLSNPSGAQIWLAPTGQTPTYQDKTTPDTVSNLPIGDYDYILKLTNFNDYISTQPITVIKDQTAIVGPINLVPAEGCIYFTSSPPGAQIFLDATPETVINTGFVTPKLICGLSLGQHCYKLVLPGYEDKTGCITLESGEGQIVTETLTAEESVLTTLTVSPSSVTITVGNTQQFIAICNDQFDSTMTCPTITWSTTDTTIGTISNTGMFSGLAEGTVTVQAISGTIIGTAIVIVSTAPPGGIVGDITVGLELLGKNLIWAASILGIAMIGSVISYKGYKEKEIEKQAEIAKKEIEKSIEMERIREREMKMLSKR